MSRPPVVTYVSVAYTTATEAPDVSETEITITTTILPNPIGVPSPLSPSAFTDVLSLETDATCSTTTATSSLSFVTIFTTSSDASVSTSLTSSSSSSSSSSSYSSSSTYSAFPASATMVAPTSTSIPIPSTEEAPRPNIGLSGTIGLSTALGIVFAAIVGFCCYYRRKRKSHKEAMLIVPRLSPPNEHHSVETGQEAFVGSASSSGSCDKGIKLERMHPRALVRPFVPVISSDATSHAYHTILPRSSSLPNPARARLAEGIDRPNTEQGPLRNNLYAIRYNIGGALSAEHEDLEGSHRANDPNPRGWEEALGRLDEIHEAATLHRELSPSPLRISKRTPSRPEDHVQPSGRTPPHPTHSDDLESVSELDIPDSPGNTEIERKRAAALATLEGRREHYTSESVYSRNPDGTLDYRPAEGAGWRSWSIFETHWPD